MTSSPGRSASWKWWVCGLLLLATMINYMDRLTLNAMSQRITDEFQLNEEQYGQIEFAFGIAFALGNLLAGWSADRWNVRWLFPVAVILWSAAGFATGYAQSLMGLMVCRFSLGFFESGNWPCALRTTQHILPPAQRTMGNSLLQSGAAIGAIVTPFIVLALVAGPGTWRQPFFVIGASGTLWAVFWLASVRSRDLAPSRVCEAVDSGTSSPAESRPWWEFYFDPRFRVLLVLVITVNLTWHFFRVWLPKFLLQKHGYTEPEMLQFTSAYYFATDLGSLAAGFGSLYLVRCGFSVHRSRLLVFGTCALLTSLSVAVAFLERGPLLLGLLLVIGFGALGLYPPYYSLSQDLTTKHQGKVSGSLGFSTWVASAIMHPLVGKYLDYTNNEALQVLGASTVGLMTAPMGQGPILAASALVPGTASKDYTTVVAAAGLFPLVGLAALYFFWKTRPEPRRSGATSPPNGQTEPVATGSVSPPEQR